MIGLQGKLIVGAIVLVAATAGGFRTGWSLQGTAKDKIMLEHLVEDQKAIQLQIDKNKIIREQRDHLGQIAAELAAAEARAAVVHTETVTKEVIRYVTTDANATDCGLSCGGVRVYNHAASGGRLPETETTQSCVDDGAIAASNAVVVEAAATSSARHWAAIRQVKGLQNYIRVECLPLGAGREEKPEP